MLRGIWASFIKRRRYAYQSEVPFLAPFQLHVTYNYVLIPAEKSVYSYSRAI